jgi:hypothetical protein
MNAFLLYRFTLCVLILLAVGICTFPRTADKVAPADLVAKHLESIGAAEARARVRGTKIKGTCEINVKQGGVGQSTGQVVMASQGMQNLINMTFDSGEPSTAFRFDGNTTTVTQFRPGRHTPLEHFFAEHQEIVREGLVGGILSESWPLLSLEQKNPKLEYAGIKKIEGKQLHAIKYTPRKGSELKITLFFDAETFRHVRTEYEQTIYSTAQQRIPGGGGTLPSISNTRSAPQRLNVREEFSDFKPEGGLNLPHVYKFELSVQSDTRPMLIDWTFNLTDFNFNAPLDASAFTVGSDTSKPK